MKEKVMAELKRTFRPEFLNRVDGTIVFHALNRNEIKQIVDLELNKVRKRLGESQLTLEVTEEAKGYLADEGYDPNFGARPLRRVIQTKVEDALSEGVLAGRFNLGDTVRVDLRDGKLAIDAVDHVTEDAEAAEPEPAL